MNATADLSALADAIEAVRADLSASAVARATGHAVSAITRDRASKQLLDWPTRDVLLLARACPELGTAIAAWIAGKPIDQGDAAHVFDAIRADVRATGELNNRVADALADNELRAREIDAIRAALAERMASDAQLDRNLRARRRMARP